MPAFRAQVRTWARGEAIPGTPAYRSGPKRDSTLVWVIDVITGTGMRPHDTFALLLDEIDVEVADPHLDVTGTLIEVRGGGRGGWERKPVPNTDNSWRRILLPTHSVEAVKETITELKASGRPNPMGLLFPSRVGTPRSPTNFGRVWRAARGTEFSWVTPRTFRRGAGTEVDRAYGDLGRAARQLGNTEGVARKHYIDIPETAPDNRDVLERWATGR